MKAIGIDKRLYLRYSIPQVWIENSYQANPGNSCSHVHIFSTRRTKNTGLQGRYATLPRPADQSFHYEMDIDLSLFLSRKCSYNNTKVE